MIFEGGRRQRPGRRCPTYGDVALDTVYSRQRRYRQSVHLRTEHGRRGKRAHPQAGKVTAGYFLEFDAARKIAQGLGAHLERLASLVEVKGDKARLVPVAERARHLFSKADNL